MTDIDNAHIDMLPAEHVLVIAQLFPVDRFEDRDALAGREVLAHLVLGEFARRDDRGSSAVTRIVTRKAPFWKCLVPNSLEKLASPA